MDSVNQHSVDAKAVGAECWNCPLNDRPFAAGHGPDPGEAVAVAIGEAPGRNEAREGRPFVGKSGQLLRATLDQLGIDPERVYMTNIVLCRPPGNNLKGEYRKAIGRCKKRLAMEIKPYVDQGVPVLTLGKEALETLLGRSVKIGLERGHWKKHGRVIGTWHPAYVLRAPMRMSEFVMDVAKLKSGPYHVQPIDYRVLEDYQDVWDTVRDIADNHDVVCVDVEAANVNWWKDHILSIGIGVSPVQAVVIPDHLAYWDITRRALDYLFARCDVVSHNTKFDVRFLRHQLGVCWPHPDRKIEDTLIGDYTLDENRMHAMKPLLGYYFDIEDYEADLVQRYLDSRDDDYSKVPRHHMYHYNALDVCYNMLLWDRIKGMLVDEGMYDMPYRYPMMDFQPTLVDVELGGIKVDTDQLDRLDSELSTEIDKCYDWLSEQAGTDFNPLSWVQVGEIMYDHFNMPTVRVPNAPARTTCEAARQQLIEHLPEGSIQHRWIVQYDRLKKLHKLLSSYVTNMRDFLAPDGHVHPDFLAYGTEVGRLSARNPAIQTIPRETSAQLDGVHWGRLVRDMFVPRDGCVWVKADYSQIELRVAAAFSQDPFLIDVYMHDRDLHSEVAEAMYGPDFTKLHRVLCKKFNYAYLYGGTIHSFSRDTRLDLQQAEQFVRRYQSVLTVLGEWMDGQLRIMREQGYVESPLGRRRRFPLITRRNLDDAKKSAIHAPIAGTATDINTIAMLRVWEENIPDVRLLATVHDEIDFEVPEGRVPDVVPKILQIMVDAAHEVVPNVPWKVDADIGYAWGSVKKSEYVAEIK